MPEAKHLVASAHGCILVIRRHGQIEDARLVPVKSMHLRKSSSLVLPNADFTSGETMGTDQLSVLGPCQVADLCIGFGLGQLHSCGAVPQANGPICGPSTSGQHPTRRPVQGLAGRRMASQAPLQGPAAPKEDVALVATGGQELQFLRPTEATDLFSMSGQALSGSTVTGLTQVPVQDGRILRAAEEIHVAGPAYCTAPPAMATKDLQLHPS
mmetsp:Transcript_63360/g.138804  ORF Transcript_63360/g.138804 Transcript_63360/m.138804 type:complete len:212 (-) Transcript_63360:198-833(-)